MSQAFSNLQRCRHVNLRRLLLQLDREGLNSWLAQSDLLGLTQPAVLKRMVAGSCIADDVAREIEWSLHRPSGWLDRIAAEPLDR
ncbi:hypothetical protein VI08_09365 [Luteibacter yeojuensis]|uniref:XRE family transcriptional regulator n=1 Tax=Luteibacter yeojuensis TaxID=345309 RepID=A0A0F3KU40_9GAMM|nr:hypothetical protein VI08_09365 [Luteibacter yeojuensis]